MVHLKLKAELRSNIKDNGERFAITSGISMLQVLSVECLALLRPPILLILEMAVDQFGWTKCSALAPKTAYTNVPIATGMYVIVDTAMTSV